MEITEEMAKQNKTTLSKNIKVRGGMSSAHRRGSECSKVPKTLELDISGFGHPEFWF